MDAVEFAKHKNVYTDTSGIASSNNLMIVYVYSRIGTDRILFGTDTYSAAFQQCRIEFALIPQEDKQYEDIITLAIKKTYSGDHYQKSCTY